MYFDGIISSIEIHICSNIFLESKNTEIGFSPILSIVMITKTNLAAQHCIFVVYQGDQIMQAFIQTDMVQQSIQITASFSTV